MSAELSWRRRWLVNLQSCPWQKMQIGGSLYLIKTLFNDENYDFMLSDLMSIWHEDMDSKTMKERIRELNPNIEAPVSKILGHIQANITTPGVMKFVTLPKKCPQDIEVLLTSNLAGMTFMWKFCGQLTPQNVLCDHLTMPMMTMITEMSRRQAELTRRLHGKDCEIADYKSQGVKTSRKHLETTPFDEMSFTNEMNTSKELEDAVKSEGVNTFTQETNDLYITLMTKYSWVTHIPTEDDEDESFAYDASADAALDTSIPSWGNRIPPSYTLPHSKGISQKKSPSKSPAKGPHGNVTLPDSQETELSRRSALNKKLTNKQLEASKSKKKKISF